MAGHMSDAEAHAFSIRNIICYHRVRMTPERSVYLLILVFELVFFPKNGEIASGPRMMGTTLNGLPKIAVYAFPLTSSPNITVQVGS